MTLPVPYKSQWDDDATATQNDCGPASIAMILNYFNEKLTTNDVFYKSGAGLGYVTFAQMGNAINNYGYKYNILTNQSVAQLKGYLDKGIPVIALVHYGYLNGRQDTFTGPHFFVVTGYDDNGYYVNDPNFWGARRGEGEQKYYSEADFEKSWNQATVDGNPASSLIVIDPKVAPTAPKPPQPTDRRPYWFDLMNAVTFKKPQESVTDEDVQKFVKEYPTQLKRSGLWDQLAIKLGFTGDTNKITVNEMLSEASKVSLQLQKELAECKKECEKLSIATVELQHALDEERENVKSKEELRQKWYNEYRATEQALKDEQTAHANSKRSCTQSLNKAKTIETYTVTQLIGEILSRVTKKK